MSTCGKCNVPITSKGSDLPLKCSGFCGKSFHATVECSDLGKSDLSIDRNALIALRNHENIIFMCVGCRACLKNVSFIELATKVETVFSKLDDVKTEPMNSLTEAVKSMEGNFKEKITELSSQVTQPPLSYASIVAPSLAPVVPPEPEIIGTGGDEDGIVSVAVKKRRFVYASRMKNTTTKQRISNYVAKKLKTSEDDILCWPLVKQGVDTATLKFISFKIGVSEEDFSKVLNASFWPDGILIREFIPKNVEFSKNLTIVDLE